MADENTIGMKAVLDTTDFEAGTKRLDAMIAALEKNLDSFEKKQADNAKRIAEAEKQAADAQKKAASEADKAAKAEEAAANKRERSIRKFAIAAAAVSAAVVVAYKTMSKAATELGDTEAIAQFEAMDAALGALRDTVLQAGLEILKASDAIPFLTDRLQTLYQVAVIVSSALVGFTTQAAALSKAGKGYGIEDLGKPGVLEELNAIDFGAIQAQAQKAQQDAMKNILAAPERRKEAEAQSEAEKEYKKAQDKKAKDLEDYIAKSHDLTIKSGESILEAERDYHDKSAEAWQSYMEKVADITADGIKKRAELARTRSEAIADAEIDYQRSIEDAQYNHGQKLVDIERDYQHAIRDAQQNYQEDALDAIRNLDAIGLIRAKEKRDKDIANAEQSRNEANTAESENYSRQLYEAQRAFEDKRREAKLAYQRGLDDQRRAEQEATQEAKDAYNKQVADAAQAYRDKQAAIDQAYRNENAAAAAQYGYAETAFRNHLVAMQNIMAQYGVGTTTRPTLGGRPRGRAEGGVDIVNTPTQFVAGEAGPELAMFVPLNRSIPAPVTQTVNHVGDFSHSIDAAISSSVAGLDGRIIATIRKAIAEVIR